MLVLAVAAFLSVCTCLDAAASVPAPTSTLPSPLVAKAVERKVVAPVLAADAISNCSTHTHVPNKKSVQQPNADYALSYLGLLLKYVLSLVRG